MPACFIGEDRLFYFCLLKEAFSKVGKKSGVVKATLLLLRGGKVLDFALSHSALVVCRTEVVQRAVWLLCAEGLVVRLHIPSSLETSTGLRTAALRLELSCYPQNAC